VFIDKNVEYAPGDATATFGADLDISSFKDCVFQSAKVLPERQAAARMHGFVAFI
jgi:hypothetical protein